MADLNKPHGAMGDCRPVFAPMVWDEKADVLVVGSGIAGLMASIEAKDRGADVLLVEMAESPYCGESAVCGGGMAIPGTDVQSRQGIDDEWMSLYRDMIEAGKGSNREELVRLFTENACDAYDRLRQLGGICNNLGYIGGHSVSREHQHDPLQIQQALFQAVQAREIRTLFGTRAQALVLSKSTGGVEGLIAVQGPSRERIALGAQATILATGGMCGNPAMLSRYVPRLDALALCAAVGDKAEERPIGLGDGYSIAMAAGADTTHMYSVSTYTGIPHLTQPGFSNRSYRPWIPSYQEGSIAVNMQGQRFIEETRSPPCEVGEAMIRQPGRTLFKVFDNRFWKTITQGAREAELIREGKAFVWEAGSVRELAIATGVDPLGLVRTVDRYNRFVDAGCDTDFGRPAEYLKPITEPPFVAHQNWLVVLHNSGGLRANKRLQIMHVRGEPIPGLYGAGEVVGGTSGEVYLTATHYPTAMTFGYLAGGRFVPDDL
jgi:fumarate reductase flavoprotein subunit